MSGYIRSSKPYFPKEDTPHILRQIGAVLENGQLRNGKNVNLFESMVADYIGIKNAVACDSDSSALETILRYYKIKNREVVVCTNSFISIPNSVISAGGKVVFSDINKDTLSMDLNSLKANLTKKTCGVILTHIAGFPNPDLVAINEICKENNLFLIEDATHAFGAILNNQKIGSFGDAAVFAFTPTKVLTTGEGGMMVTPDAELAEFAKRYRYYGSGSAKTTFVELGRHMMLPEISAILGISQLKRIEEFIAKRNELAHAYDELLKETEEITTIKCPMDCRSSYYKYPLILDSRIDRAAFVRLLDKEFGIETGNVFYPPCHLQEFYKKLSRKSYGSLLTSESVLSRTITLPMHVGLTIDDVKFVVAKIAFLCSEIG